MSHTNRPDIAVNGSELRSIKGFQLYCVYACTYVPVMYVCTFGCIASIFIILLL